MKLRNVVHYLLATLLWPWGSAAAADVCQPIADAYRTGLKEAAYFEYSPAARKQAGAVNVAAKINNSLLLAQMNLSLLVQNSCPPVTQPADPGFYASEALSCWAALVHTNLHKAPLPAACDLSKWHGGSGIDVPEPPSVIFDSPANAPAGR